MARCSACPKCPSVTVAGLIRRHVRDVWLGGPNYRTEPCPGSGKPPRDGMAGVRSDAVARLSSRFPPSVARRALADYSAEKARIAAVVAEQADDGKGPRGWRNAQRRAYAKVGLRWPPET